MSVGKSDMSASERDAMLDQIVAEIHGDKPAGGETGETHETPVGGDDSDLATGDAATGDVIEGAKGEGDGKEPEEPSEKDDWLDEETRDFAKQLGVTDEDLEGFKSREDLDRVLRILDRKAYEAGKEAQALKAKAQAEQFAGLYGKQQVPGESRQRESAKREEPGDVFEDLAKFKLGDEYDREAAAPVNAFIDAAASEIRRLRSELSEFREARRADEAVVLRNRALESLHSLGHADLFGKPGEKLTREQEANIEKAMEAHFIHANGLIALGRQPAPTPEFLKVAVRMAFGDELSKTEQRRLTDRLRKQSARRSGGPPAKGAQPIMPPANETSLQFAERVVEELKAELG